MLSFLQINLHKASQATVLLGGRLEGKKRTVVLATEPYTMKNKVVGFPRGTKVICSGRESVLAPRAAIVASLDTNITAMDSWCNRDCAVALTNVGGVRTVLVSLYLDIKLDVQPDWLDGLMRMIDDKGYPVIIGVDSNAHSSMYGPDNNARGNAFEDFVLQYGLCVENLGTKPTFETRRENGMVRTHIDVTLSRDIQAPIRGWRVDDGYNASDHNTILFETETYKTEPELSRQWSKANWGIFKERLTHANYGVPKDMSMKKLDKLVDRVYGILEKALDKACPRVAVRTGVSKSH